MRAAAKWPVRNAPFGRWFSTDIPEAKFFPQVYHKLLTDLKDQPEDALRLLKTIPIEDRKASHFNTTIGAFKHDWEQALDIFNAMRNEKNQLPMPNQLTYSTTIMACGLAGEWEKAIELLNLMQFKDKVMPNRNTYNAAILAMAKCGKWRQALNLLETMEREGLQPDSNSINGVIKACATGGEVNTALNLLSSMSGGTGLANRAEPLNPQEESVPTLRFQEVTADIHSFNSVMRACANGGQLRVAIDLFGRMRQGSVAPNSTTFNYMICSCARAQRWDFAVKIFVRMCDSGFAHGLQVPRSAHHQCSTPVLTSSPFLFLIRPPLVSSSDQALRARTECTAC
jgi:pentatricopeptide repeat domain-containing protein 1